MPTTQTRYDLSEVEFHPLGIIGAKGSVTNLAPYMPRVAYKQATLRALGVPEDRHSQIGMIEFLNRYNTENMLGDEAAIRPASPDIENVLAMQGYEHPAFDDQFARNGLKYFISLSVISLMDAQLRKPRSCKKEYVHPDSTPEYPLWERDLWTYDLRKGDWVKIGEGRRIEPDGVILAKDGADGLPTKTTGVDEHRVDGKEHWSFDPKLDIAALCRSRVMEQHGFSNCLYLCADLKPSYSDADMDFAIRPVMGPFAKFRSLRRK